MGSTPASRTISINDLQLIEAFWVQIGDSFYLHYTCRHRDNLRLRFWFDGEPTLRIFRRHELGIVLVDHRNTVSGLQADPRVAGGDNVCGPDHSGPAESVVPAYRVVMAARTLLLKLRERGHIAPPDRRRAPVTRGPDAGPDLFDSQPPEPIVASLSAVPWARTSAT